MNSSQIRFILDALDEPEILNEWENDFINDLAVRDNDNYILSNSQNKKLNQIAQKIALSVY